MRFSGRRAEAVPNYEEGNNTMAIDNGQALLALERLRNEAMHTACDACGHCVPDKDITLAPDDFCKLAKELRFSGMALRQAKDGQNG